jgi:protein ImuB
MFACLYTPDFPVQAALYLEPEDRRELLKQSSVVVVDGPASLLRVIAANQNARRAGIADGMTRLQAESFGGVVTRKRRAQNEGAAQAALLDCARAFSPRVESTSPGTVILDLHGTEKLFGLAPHAARKIALSAREFGFDANISVASNPDTALCAARGFQGITVIAVGEEAARMAGLPVGVLSPAPEILDILESWGIRNFGALAALPSISLSERLGQDGLQLQRLASGKTRRTLVPAETAQDFTECFEFEDPVETLESLTFILNRLLGLVCMRLMSRSLGANELRLKLELEARQLTTGAARKIYERVWKLPLPIADAMVLFRLACLDLNASSFSAPVKSLTVEAVPAKPRSAQGGLFVPVSPEAEQLEITLARIRGVVGNTDENGTACVGSPEVLDSHRPDSFTLKPFSPEPAKPVSHAHHGSTLVMRLFRPALVTSVEVNDGKPWSVLLGKRALVVLAASGPWCGSGQWWNASSTWAREEWDVALKMPEGTGLYRVFLDRLRRQWFVEGMFD